MGKDFNFVKVGRINSEGHMLFHVTPHSISRVIECDVDERNKQYVFKQPCPFCGLKHSHGAGEGLRVSHCNPERIMFMQIMFHGTKAPDYYIVSTEEYRKLWSKAIKGEGYLEIGRELDGCLRFFVKK